MNIRKTHNHSPKHKHTSQDQPHYAICDIAQTSDMEINLFEKSSFSNQKTTLSPMNQDISPIDKRAQSHIQSQKSSKKKFGVKPPITIGCSGRGDKCQAPHYINQCSSEESEVEEQKELLSESSRAYIHHMKLMNDISAHQLQT